MEELKKVLRFVKPYWQWAVLAPLLMVIEVAMDLMQPTLIRRIVDQGVAAMDMTVVIRTGLLMVALTAVGALGGMGCTYFAIKAAVSFGVDLRGALFRKVQALSFGNLDKLETGQLVTRLTNDVTQVQEALGMMLRMAVRAPLLLIGSIIMAIVTSPRLAWILAVLVPLVIVLVTWVISRAYPLFSGVQSRLDGLNTVVQENLAGVRVVKAFVRSDHEAARFDVANRSLMDITMKASRTVAVSMPAMMLLINVGIVAVLWFGGAQVKEGSLMTGSIIAFINYLMRTLMSLMFVSMLVMRFSRAQASAERIVEVLDSEPEVQDKPEALPDFMPEGYVTFEDVTFSYNGDEQDPVLQNISFSAKPGQVVAILGATGSGKSSLVHLIPRFYDVSNGRILIDGVDVRDMDNQALRSIVGVALQESVLFTGTIRDNIRYGRPEASDEQVVAAAKAAQAHDFIMTLPDGYDTDVSQRGVNLSGGQKQRIAIARALLINPTVLILDDSTSAVDVETEIKIQEALDRLMANRTSFVIAQRISTVLNADKILVLDDGRIMAEGTHTDLLESSPIYREIYDSQLGNGVVENGAD